MEMRTEDSNAQGGSAAAARRALSPPRRTREKGLLRDSENSPRKWSGHPDQQQLRESSRDHGLDPSGRIPNAHHNPIRDVELVDLNESGDTGVRKDVCQGASPQHTGGDMGGAGDKTNIYVCATKADGHTYMPDSPSHHGSSLCLQLGVTMKRILILQYRAPIAFACELMIPVIFLLGSVVLWVIIKNPSFPATDYFSVVGESITDLVMTQALRMLCYNATLSGGTAIANLPECGDFVATFRSPPQLLCADSIITGAPVGLCVVGSVANVTYLTMRHNIPWSTVSVPSLDQMIVLQWIWRILLQSFDFEWGNDKTVDSAMLSSGALFFAPQSAETKALVAHFQNTSTYFRYVYGGTFATVAEAEAGVKSRTFKDPPIWGIIEVSSMTADSFDVAIRLNATALPWTKKILTPYYVGGIVEDGAAMYILSGFTTLQRVVYEYFLSNVVGMAKTPERELLMLAAPTRAYKDAQFLSYGRQFVPLIVVLGFLYPVSQMTKRVVLEKELRLREAMLIMGLSEAIMYTAWFLVYVVQYAVISLLIAILLRVTYLKATDFGVVAFTFFIFCLSLITLSGLIAVFFSKARLSSILAPLIYSALAIPLFAVPNLQGPSLIGLSILSPSGLSIAVKLIFHHELSGGMTVSGLTYFRDSPKLLLVLIILFVDFLLYFVLMLYLDAVLPKQWGTRKHPLFFIIGPVRWLCCRSDVSHHVNKEDGRAKDGVFEEVSEGDADYAVRIVGLRKEYRRGGKKFVAVNNLYWGMREGEISVLLGHNGAGKTTTMNMMTGMISADAGDCYIYGSSVRTQLNQVRRQIGYCPQHNILWPSMTCYEHLWYYASVKGVRGAEREKAISCILASVDLGNKRDYRSQRLSGGQKRKLSVAIAFVGGSRLVFLDEPTAGMDVGARRHTWGLLRTMSKDHSILLSTHFMDEADLLGDSVAIMSKGRLQCAGSNMFLKSKLGVGYVLTLSVVAHVNRPTIVSAVRKYVPSATQLGSGAGEMSFRLAMETKATFPNLLAEIEERGSQLGINAYSVSATTLEEIFIRIAQQEGKTKAGKKRPYSTAPDTVSIKPASTTDKSSLGNGIDSLSDLCTLENVSTEPLQPSDVWNVSRIVSELGILYSQLEAMLRKRLWNALRDRRTQFFQVVCPMMCVLFSMLLMQIKLFQSPAITLSSDLFDTAVEIDVAGCASAINSSIPFSSRAVTVQPPSATSVSSLSSYMLATYNSHMLERYNGLVCVDTTSLPRLNTSERRMTSAVIYNNSALHTSAIGLFDLYNGYYMAYRGNKASVMTTVVYTMPRTKTEDEVVSSIYGILISVIIMIPFTFIPSTFVSWIVKERECKARHLQNVSGLSFSVYWLANFLFDICCYTIMMFLVITILAIFNREEYIGKAAASATVVLFFLYGLTGVAMSYAVSFLFREHSTAQNVVMLANFIAGFLLVLSVAALSFLASTKHLAKLLRWFFRVVPSYCVGEGIVNLATLKMEEAFGTGKTPWSMSVVGWPCLYMLIELPIYVFIIFFIDHPGRRQRAQRLFHNPDEEPEIIEDEDEDVLAERKSVLRSAARQGDLVRVENLHKVYSNGKVAVRNITFGVHPGEVFGFLGTNGAGKTTTISILCQELYPTSGHATICGKDIVTDSREALQCIGYCPQFDATIDLLTVKEHLELYAGVRGIRYEERERVVKGLMALCELTDYKNTLAHELSGGNRRKLSVAVSLIGGPRVVFLDEPSAGMDPVARRGLWNAIEKVADNSSVVLTTHHLEEVEALAHRVAIMVDGTLRCIGDKTHLKRKFGTGFEVNVRIRSEDGEVKEAMQSFFEANFPGSSLREYRARRFTYELPGDTKLSRTFKLMEENAAALGATDYSVSQTSIEQVFLQISDEAERRHEAEDSERLAQEENGCCACCC